MDDRNEMKLAKVHPGLAKRVRRFLTACEAAGCPMRITQGVRDGIEQIALYAQGRQPLAEVNRLRKLACLVPLHAHENDYPVTNAKPGFSFHQYGLAVDVCYATGDPYKEAEHSLTWAQIGEQIKAADLEWGGDFPHPDNPHAQWKGGLTLRDLRMGKVPAMDQG